MRRWLPLCALLLAGAVNAGSEPDFQAFDRYVQAAADDWEVPGLAIAVVHGGELAFARGYGTTALAGGTPVDEHTLFSIGSTTKAIAAASVGLLVDRGHFTWDTLITEVLPQLKLSDPDATARLRVRDLLTHDAGLPNLDFLWYRQETTLDDILHRVRYADMAYPPGSSFEYQNVMYAAAGRLVEVTTGGTWGDFVEREIFARLGMDRTVATLAKAETRSNVAQPHHRIDGAITQIDNASVDVVAAAGSVWSSVHDMSIWARFLLRGCVTEGGKALLEPETCEELFRPQTIVDREMYPAMRLYDHKWLTYGLGWFQTNYDGRVLDFHSGSIDGLVALFGLVRAEGAAVYVLGNLDHAEVRHALMYRGLDLVRPHPSAEPARDWNREIKELFDGLARDAEDTPGATAVSESRSARPPRAAASYVGSYEHRLGGRVVIAGSEDAGLELRWGTQRCNLAPVDADEFRCPWQRRWRGAQQIRFAASATGTVDTLALGGMRFARTSN